VKDNSEKMRQHTLANNFLLDIDNNAYPCENFLNWAYEFEILCREDRDIVRRQDIAEFWISTFFLGINFQFDLRANARPLLFETVIAYSGNDGLLSKLDKYQRRYSTWKEALAGHEEAATMIRRVLN